MKTHEPRLYTVVLHFSDHRNGIGQYEATSPQDAFLKFIKQSESLYEYNRDDLTHKAFTASPPLIHVANDLRGFWIWVRGKGYPRDIYGGYIIQTDTNAPKRPKSYDLPQT